MTQRLLQMKHTSTTTKVVDRECVTKCVQGSGWSIEPELSAQNLDASERRHSPHRRVVACRKEQVVRFSLKVRNEPMHGFAQYERKRNDPLLAALSVQREKHVFHVHITDSQRQCLSDARAGVQQQ